MTRIRTLLTSLLIGAALVGVACSDSPIGPTTVASEPEAPEDSVPPPPDEQEPSGDEAQVLERSESLEEDEVVTQTVGIDGATLTLAEAGLTVVIPPLALAQDTEITITAPAGNLVGYHFAPHGLEFALPVLVTQDLSTTLGLGLTGMTAVYFEGELEPTVTPLEELPLVLLNLLGIFEITHFSCYVIATN